MTHNITLRTPAILIVRQILHSVRFGLQVNRWTILSATPHLAYFYSRFSDALPDKGIAIYITQFNAGGMQNPRNGNMGSA